MPKNFDLGWSVGLRNPNPALLTHAPSARPKTRLDATFLSEELKVDKRSKKVTCVGPAQNGPSQKSFYGPPQFFAGEKTTENNRSLFGPPELVYKSDNQTLVLEWQRANSTGQISYAPFPRIQCVRDISNAFQDY